MMKNKAAMIGGYGVGSTSDLEEYQLDDLILYLEKLEKDKQAELTIEVREWRHKVLRMVAECGIDTQDWNKVNAFVCQSRIAGKHLYECSLDELKALHRKLHNVAVQKQKQKEKEQLQTLMN
jgi:hypothetical protein